MTSTYTSNLGIEKPATGDQSGTWGDTTNTNFDIVDRAIAGVGSITLSGTSHTLTTTDGSLTDGMFRVLVLAGSPTGTNTVTISPNDQDKFYLVKNGSGQSAVFSQGTGANVTIPNGGADIIFADGAGSGAAVSSIFANSLSFGKINLTSDTAAGDAAALGATGTEGLILTGQGSTNDVTIKNDADQDVLEIPTGTQNVTVAGDFTAAGTLNVTGDTSAGDSAAIGFAAADGLVLTGQGSTNDVTIRNDADAEVCGVPTGTDDLRFPDDAKIEMGTGGDLQLYHDASNSYIVDNGTGNLKIAGSQIDFMGGADSGETMATLADNGAVTLYHDNTARVATSGTGIAVTGTVIATTDTDTSNTGSVTLDFGTNQNFVLTLTGNVTLANPSTEQVGQAGIIVFIQDGTGSRTVTLGTDYETAASGGLTLSTAASAVDVVPYFVKASGSIQLGAPQLAFG
tara:strand:+ start:332 stop:1699 length:1368 start_codon:yes stop_codon:yes gene_type:complete